MTNRLEMPVEQFAEAVAKENARLNEEIERLNNEKIIIKASADGASSLLLDVQQDCIKLQNEVDRLKQKCDKQAMILRRLTPENFPNTYFIHGDGGTKDINGMPERIYVVPAYGCDWSQVYERTDKVTGPEW